MAHKEHDEEGPTLSGTLAFAALLAEKVRTRPQTSKNTGAIATQARKQEFEDLTHKFICYYQCGIGKPLLSAIPRSLSTACLPVHQKHGEEPMVPEKATSMLQTQAGTNTSQQIKLASSVQIKHHDLSQPPTQKGAVPSMASCKDIGDGQNCDEPKVRF